jgi:hypothetical protein
MGRHHLEDMTAESRRDSIRMGVVMAKLQDSFDALKAKVEQAAAARDAQVDQVETQMAEQIDALTRYVHDTFLGDGSVAAATDAAPADQPVDQPVDEPAHDAAPSSGTAAEAPGDSTAAPAVEEATTVRSWPHTT